MIRWASGTPAEEGWHLCAWEKGEEYVYALGRWTGTDWECSMGIPAHHQKIVSPAEEMKRLDQMLNEIKNQK